MENSNNFFKEICKNFEVFFAFLIITVLCFAGFILLDSIVFGTLSLIFFVIMLSFIIRIFFDEKNNNKDDIFEKHYALLSQVQNKANTIVRELKEEDK